jgi:hypothetical protein
MLMLTLGFPPGVLFDLMMRGGPIPERYEHLGDALVRPGELEFSPEEAVVIREWLQTQSDDIVDVDARDTSIELVNRALRDASVCSVCGGLFIVDDREGQARCARCGEEPE